MGYALFKPTLTRRYPELAGFFDWMDEFSRGNLNPAAYVAGWSTQENFDVTTAFSNEYDYHAVRLTVSIDNSIGGGVVKEATWYPVKQKFTQLSFEVKARIASALTNFKAFYGLFDNTSPATNYFSLADPATRDHIGFVRDSDLTASTWNVVNSDGTTQKATDTGVAVDTNWHVYRFVWQASSILFYIDEVLYATHTVNLPGVPLFAHLIGQRLVTVGQVLDVDRIVLKYS